MEQKLNISEYREEMDTETIKDGKILKKNKKLKKEKIKSFCLFSSVMLLLLTIFAIFVYKGINNSKVEVAPNKIVGISKYIENSERRCVIFGFSTIPKTLIPILVKHLDFKEYIIINKYDIDKKELDYIFNLRNDKKKKIKYSYIKKHIEYGKVKEEIAELLKDKDVVIDLLSRISNEQIVKGVATKKDIIYLNAGLEDQLEEPTVASGYNENIFKLLAKKIGRDGTYIYNTGANPGMITHFCIMGLYSMAREAISKGVKDAAKIKELLDKKDLPGLTQQLEVHTIHISEKEDMNVNDPKKIEGKTISSWSVDSFTEEFFAEGEISKGTMDAAYFEKQKYVEEDIDFIPRLLVTPPTVYLKTSSPFGIFTGRLTHHPEIQEISEIFSNKNHNLTVGFVYSPSKITRKQFFVNKDWEKRPKHSFTEKDDGPLSGYESMGAVLISGREDIPPRWYGSFVTCEDSRKTGCITNPTSLQVGAGLYSHLVCGLENPKLGIVLPHSCNSEKIMELATPYLGTIYDVSLPYRLPYKFEDLLSTEDEMNNDF